MSVVGSMIKIAIINDTRVTSHYGCMLVMENLLALLEKNNVEVVWTWQVSIDWRKHKSEILNKPPVDAIIVNGEGTIHHSKDRKFAKALAEFAEFSYQVLKTPAYLINATLYKNDAAEYEKLKAYRAIYVRDKGSLEELESFKLEGKYVPDLTFAKNKTEYPKLLPTQKTVIIDSAIKEDNPILKDFANANDLPFKSMIVARRRNAKFIRSPRPYVKNILKYIATDRKLSTAPSTYIQYLRNHSLVITGRYHTVSMCIKNKIPFVAIDSNTPKIRYLLTDAIGETKRNITITELNNINLSNDYQYSDGELEKMGDFIKKSENMIDQMISHIVKDIEMDQSNKYCY
jgi:exopolysaccharide biosynthesis predicted pyruvyltransferase EpsI